MRALQGYHACPPGLLYGHQDTIRVLVLVRFEGLGLRDCKIQDLQKFRVQCAR